jgi:hypothetical protein
LTYEAEIWMWCKKGLSKLQQMKLLQSIKKWRDEISNKGIQQGVKVETL